MQRPARARSSPWSSFHTLFEIAPSHESVRAREDLLLFLDCAPCRCSMRVCGRGSGPEGHARSHATIHDSLIPTRCCSKYPWTGGRSYTPLHQSFPRRKEGTNGVCMSRFGDPSVPPPRPGWLVGVAEWHIPSPSARYQFGALGTIAPANRMDASPKPATKRWHRCALALTEVHVQVQPFHITIN